MTTQTAATLKMPLPSHEMKDAQPLPVLSYRFMDFWLMGGASLVMWALLTSTQYFRNDYSFVGMRFEQVGGAFSLLALICNHPHFMASYRLAYGRGRGFILTHWFTLIAVPATLIGFYALAFLKMTDPVSDAPWAPPLNAGLSAIHVGYRFGAAGNYGTEILAASVWLMYLTVGWHYSKQVFGCMSVYGNYDKYPISKNQRLAMKFSVFGVAFYSFCHLNFHWRDYYPMSGSFQFIGLSVGELDLPAFLETFATLFLLSGIAGFLYFVIYKNYRDHGKLPSANFLVPFVAFYAWWVPIFKQREFYFMMVPFFHSLQYLPFAMRMELNGLNTKAHAQKKFALRMVILLLAGFLAFEAIPSLLDSRAAYYSNIGIASFFTIAFAVFINVHHFFIDSVLWRFQDPNVRQALLSPEDVRRLP